PGVGKGHVRLALPREVGVEVEAVADVDDEDEGRPAVAFGQGAGVAEGLLAGALHGKIPEAGAAPGRAGLTPDREAERRLLGGARVVAALLGLQHEGAFSVEVDEAGRGLALAVVERDGALERVGVLVRAVGGRARGL